MMELKELALPSINKFASDYIKNKLAIQEFFHYDLQEQNVYRTRLKDLQERTFKRQELAEYISTYMSPLGLTDKIKQNLNALVEKDTTVVIGGQQAGLLSGPLYTIHKIISIIKLAEQQSLNLGKKVVPVFWVAGEDHDLQEVNHVFVQKGNRYEKVSYPYYQETKSMISDVPLDFGTVERWASDVFQSFGETRYTKTLLEEVKYIASESNNFSDFFVKLVHSWFKDYGLLIIDAADEKLRRHESDYFEQLILNQEQITNQVMKQQSFMIEKGYKRTIELEDYAANLFFYDIEKHERALLFYDPDTHQFKDKAGAYIFTKEQLLELAKQKPECLSNNVVSRPIMQEMLFPVLAFISGPGEVAYWSELKLAFEWLEMKMPPIVPRLNITFIEKDIQKALHEIDVDIYEVLAYGIDGAKSRFLNSIKDSSIESLYGQMKNQLIINHQMLSQAALHYDKGLEPLLKKNADLINEQLDFIYDRINGSVEKKHNHILNKYIDVQNQLRPLSSPQERIINLYYYLNKYGPEFIPDLMKVDLEFNSMHKVVLV
ncbi:bacillithiol biosynthesis cysteine-adding enzyme BshC [Peribacillus alkalitolerans]|uniref:bacillithiol biosynthesis cysteine-adding enzyme BshC n=1 Tax=Peribacillus alkalitolerans TaxID=1550385 RepID=UPI0013D44F3C|nr:bacillithiol biosynthesis cysteine-adding enzyme BshC [Peribacillus alkalitolerans]